MSSNQLVPGGYIGRGEDCPDLVERHLQRPEAANHLGDLDLVGRVPAVAGRRVDGGGIQQADAVVVAERS